MGNPHLSPKNKYSGKKKKPSKQLSGSETGSPQA
jgi:hypothetical protein